MLNVYLGIPNLTTPSIYHTPNAVSQINICMIEYFKNNFHHMTDRQIHCRKTIVSLDEKIKVGSFITDWSVKTHSFGKPFESKKRMTHWYIVIINICISYLNLKSCVIITSVLVLREMNLHLLTFFYFISQDLYSPTPLTRRAVSKHENRAEFIHLQAFTPFDVINTTTRWVHWTLTINYIFSYFDVFVLVHS